MPLRIAVITTSPGQGSTTYATGLAWSAAADRSVRLIDADPAVGTVRTLLDLDGRASIENVLGSAAVQAAALEAQSIRIEKRPQLSVVPGFRRWEFRHGQVIGRLAPALSQLPDDVVIVDIGCPFDPPESGAQPATAMLGAHFDAVLVVLRAQADLLERAIRLLDGAPLSRARLVVCRPPQRREMDRTLALLREHLPAFPDPLEWDWDHSRVLKYEVRGEPVHSAGMLEETGLLGEGQPVPTVTSGRGRGRFRFSSRRSEP
jgi:MinD-like ATPase involved in chromosome partitioning or flagellar assembly